MTCHGLAIVGVPVGRTRQREGFRKASSALFEEGVCPVRGRQRGKGFRGSKGAVHPTGTVIGAGDSKVNKRDRVGPSQSSHSAVGRERLTCSK